MNKFIWCSNEKEAKALVKHAREIGKRWWDGSEFVETYVKGGVGFNLDRGCFICKVDLEKSEGRYSTISYEDYMKTINEVQEDGEKAGD